jgi:hypothetical protein
MSEKNEPDLKASLIEAWEAIQTLQEKVDDLVLQQSATLIALAKTLPVFAQEFDREYTDSEDAQKEHDSEIARQFVEFLRKLRKDRT